MNANNLKYKHAIAERDRANKFYEFTLKRFVNSYILNDRLTDIDSMYSHFREIFFRDLSSEECKNFHKKYKKDHVAIKKQILVESLNRYKDLLLEFQLNDQPLRKSVYKFWAERADDLHIK